MVKYKEKSDIDKISGEHILLAPAKNSEEYNKLLKNDILNLAKRYNLTLNKLLERLILLKEETNG
jgi:hypothetical protein